MIPSFINPPGALYPILPPGIYELTMEEVSKYFATNSHRIAMFYGLKAATINLFSAGCPYIYLDGSYVTDKPLPGDYDVVWASSNVDSKLLDPIFLDPFARAGQKQKYSGEFFPGHIIERSTKKSFFDYFQEDSRTSIKKGIVSIKNYIY